METVRGNTAISICYLILESIRLKSHWSIYLQAKGWNNNLISPCLIMQSENACVRQKWALLFYRSFFHAPNRQSSAKMPLSPNASSCLPLNIIYASCYYLSKDKSSPVTHTYTCSKENLAYSLIFCYMPCVSQHWNAGSRQDVWPQRGGSGRKQSHLRGFSLPPHF